jgi:hypothetical protein
VKHESVLASGAGISVFLFCSLQIRRNETEILCVSYSRAFSCRNDTLPVSLPLPLSSPPLYLSSWTNERTNQTNRKEHKANGRVLHSRVIPEVAVARSTGLASVWRPKWGAQGGVGGGGTSWDGTESRQNDATREFVGRVGSVSHWNGNLRHFLVWTLPWFGLQFPFLMNIPHPWPNVTSQGIVVE